MENKYKIKYHSHRHSLPLCVYVASGRCMTYKKEMCSICNLNSI